MKRILSLFLAVCLIAACAAVFSGCSGSKDDNFPVTVGVAEITAEPQRVVVLNDAFADIILYIGYDIKLAGRSYECDQQMLNILPSVGTGTEPAIDTLLNLNPDLVIADESLSTKSRNKLDEGGVTVVTLTPANTQEEIRQLYIDLGTALGGKTDGSKKGEDAYNKLFKLLNEYSTTTKNIVVTDAYLYLDDQGSYCTFVKDSVQAKIFGYNGAINVFANKTSPQFRATETTDENGNVTAADEMYIRYASPTNLFLDGTVAKDGTIQSAVYDKLIADPNLNVLSALNEGRVTFIPLKNFYRPGVTFEETLFTMIDARNKDEEAAEEASLNPTETATEAPTAAATKPAEEPTEAEEETEEEEEAVEDAGVSDDGAVSDGVYYDENGNVVYY